MRQNNMRKHNIFFFVVLLILLMLNGCGDENSSRNESQLEKKADEKVKETIEGTIVALGDSLTEGLGVEEELAYPAVLEQKLKAQGYPYRVINAGISGETSSGTLSRIKWLLTLKPDIVILVIGANDGFRGIETDLIESNIRAIIKQLKTNQVTVVLGGMQIVQNLGREYTTAFSEIYSRVARAEETILIPFFLADVAAQKTLNQPDGIHPTAAGYRVIVDNMMPYVVEAIGIHRQK
jgi:acyl-CoA thioesterase-1